MVKFATSLPSVSCVEGASYITTAVQHVLYMTEEFLEY